MSLAFYLISRVSAGTFRPTDTSRRHKFILWRPGLKAGERKRLVKSREKARERDTPEEEEKVWESRHEETDSTRTDDCEEPDQETIRASRSETEHRQRRD